MFIHRQISEQVKRAAEQLPVLFLTGPRQSGKTTLLRHLFPDYNFVNFEEPDIRHWAIEQPREFLENNPRPIIIDEAQYVPDIFSYIQSIVDTYQEPGMYILSGSQNFLMMEKITQSLAGRTAVLSLFPFSYREIQHLDTNSSTNECILNGFYPRLFHDVTDRALFYKSYVNTYVERDVRQLANIGNVNDFVRFMRLCAGRSGQLLNISSLATETGITYNTCKTWISYLTTGNIIRLLPPYYKNFNKKIVKAPKLFFTDTGLLCYLLDISSAETLALHPLRGAIFETLIYTELMKANINTGERASLWFWRDNHGTEIDFLLESNATIHAIEVKSGTNFHEEYLKNLRKFRKYNPHLHSMFLVYDGTIHRRKEDIIIENWREGDFLPLNLY